MALEFDTNEERSAKIKVVGVGGAGNNAVNRMIDFGVKGAEFIAVNTDIQALRNSKAATKIQIGEKLTKGLGSGGDPDVGRDAADESRDEIDQMIGDTDLLFIAAGLGGGTGTGAAPVIADVAKSRKDRSVLTVAVVTKPFSFEGRPRTRAAEKGFDTLKDSVDSIITIPNDKLFQAVGKGTPIVDAFKVADDVLRQGVQGIIDIIERSALINLDYADLSTVLSQKGVAHMGIGVGYGDNKTSEAVRLAIESPLLDTSIAGAKGIIYNITGDPSIGLFEIEEASRIIQEAADPEANIFFGVAIDPTLDDEVRVTVIANGFGGDGNAQPSITQNQPMSAAGEKKLQFGRAPQFGAGQGGGFGKEKLIYNGDNDEAEEETERFDGFGTQTSAPEFNPPQTQQSPQKQPVAPVRGNEPQIFGNDDELDFPVFIRKKPKRPRSDY